MNRRLGFLSAVCLALCCFLTACGQAEPSASSLPTTGTGETVQTTGNGTGQTPADPSFDEYDRNGTPDVSAATTLSFSGTDVSIDGGACPCTGGAHRPMDLYQYAGDTARHLLYRLGGEQQRNRDRAKRPDLHRHTVGRHGRYGRTRRYGRRTRRQRALTRLTTGRDAIYTYSLPLRTKRGERCRLTAFPSFDVVIESFVCDLSHTVLCRQCLLSLSHTGDERIGFCYPAVSFIF